MNNTSLLSGSYESINPLWIAGDAEQFIIELLYDNQMTQPGSDLIIKADSKPWGDGIQYIIDLKNAVIRERYEKTLKALKADVRLNGYISSFKEDGHEFHCVYIEGVISINGTAHPINSNPMPMSLAGKFGIFGKITQIYKNNIKAPMGLGDNLTFPMVFKNA